MALGKVRGLQNYDALIFGISMFENDTCAIANLSLRSISFDCRLRRSTQKSHEQSRDMMFHSYVQALLHV